MNEGSFRSYGDILDESAQDKTREPEYKKEFDRPKVESPVGQFLPDVVRSQISDAASSMPVSPIAAFKNDEFTDEERKRRQAKLIAARNVLFSSNIEKMTPEFASGFYQAVHRGLFGLEDPDGKVAFGSRASDDPKKNLEMLRRFCKGEHQLIEDDEQQKWRQMSWEEKFKYAREHESARNSFASIAKGERGASFGELVYLSTVAGSEGMMLPPPGGDPNREATKEISRKINYDTMTPEEKKAYETDVIADYEERLMKNNRLATYLSLTDGLSDRARLIVAKGVNDGECDIDALRQLRGEEPQRALTAIKLARGNKTHGLGMDFSTGTTGDRIQMGIYGFAQGVAGLITDTAAFAKDVGVYAFAKAMNDDREFRELSEAMSFRMQVENAFKQDLPEAQGFFGEAFQGVMENLHWFIPYSMILRGGKAMEAATDIARPTFGETLKAIAKNPRSFGSLMGEYGKTLIPLRNAKLAKAGAELAEEADKFDILMARGLGGMMAVTATGGKTVAKTVNPLTVELLSRQAAAVDKLRRGYRSAKLMANAKDAGGAALATTGATMNFATFAREYMDNAVAAGIDWDDALMTSAAVGLVNAKIETIWVPGMDGGLSRGELGMLTMASFRQALANTVRKTGKGGLNLKEFLGKWVRHYVAEGGRVAIEEGLIEEPLQQMVIEHGIAFDKILKEYGYTGPSQIFNALIPTADDWKAFIDTAIEMLPNDFGFAITALPMAVGKHSAGQRAHNFWAKHWTYRRDEQKRREEWMSEKGTMEGYEPSPMPTMYGSNGELSPEMLRGDYSKITDLDYGVVDMIQREMNIQRLVKDEWRQKEGDESKGGERQQRFEQRMQQAREVWNSNTGTGDVVSDVADALGVDRRTAEVACGVFRAESEFSRFSPKTKAVLNANFVMASLTEADLKEVNPNIVDGSFVRDEKTGSVSAKIRIDVGEGKAPVEKTVVYRMRDGVIDENEVAAQAKKGSRFGDSWNEKNSGAVVHGRKVGSWDELTDGERLEIVNRARFTTPGVTEPGATLTFTDKDGKETEIKADFLVNFATGRVGDIGYGNAARRSISFHENFHVLWDSIKDFIPLEDRKDLAQKFGIDVSDGNDWDSQLQERMAAQLELYSGGRVVPQFSREVIEKGQGNLRKALGNLVEWIAPRTLNPETGREYELKDFYDAVLRGDIGSAAELLKSASVSMPEKGGATAATASRIPGEVTEEEISEKDEGTKEAAATDVESEPAPAAPAQPVVRRPSWDHGDRIDRKCPGKKWKLKCRLVLMSVHDLITQQAQGRDVTAKDYKDRVDEMARTWEIEEGTKIDNTVLLGVPTAFTKDVVPGAVDKSVFAGNTRTSAILKIYENGGDMADAFKASQEQLADERGLEKADGWENDPIVVALLEEVEVPESEKMPTAQEIADASNGNIASAYGASESAGAHATILIANNLIPLFQIDTKTGLIVDNDEAYKTSRVNPIGEFYRKAGGKKALPDFYRKDTTSLSDDGQRILRNAILSALFGGRGGETVARLMSEADRLGMQNEMAAIVQLAPELLTLANDREHAKYDLREPLVEALRWIQRWLDADESARKSAGKTHAEWKRRKDGRPVEPAAIGTTWENFREGDMTEQPSPEARILGDLLASAHGMLAWESPEEDGAERASEASKLSARRLVIGYIRDYLENVRNATAPVEDGLFGGTDDASAFEPPSVAEVLETQRQKGRRFSAALDEIGEDLAPERIEQLQKRYAAAAGMNIRLTPKDIKLAISRFGQTDDFSKAIYFLPDGTMLQGKGTVYTFGGRRIEAFGHDGWVDLILEKMGGTGDLSGMDLVAEEGGRIEAAQRAIAKAGAIRISGDKNGFTISHEPTPAQYDALYDMAEKAYNVMESNGDDEMMIDVTDENFNTLFTLVYPRGTSARRMIDDLKGWYERGERPGERRESLVSMFHYAAAVEDGIIRASEYTLKDIADYTRDHLRDLEGLGRNHFYRVLRDVLAGEGGGQPGGDRKGPDASARSPHARRQISPDGVRKLFSSLNSDPETARIFDLVMPVAERLGTEFHLGVNPIPLDGIMAQHRGGYVGYYVNKLGGPWIDDQGVANALLHEIIHSVTDYALDFDEYGGQGGGVKISPELRTAAEELRRWYADNWAALFPKYASWSYREAIAELGNPNVRKRLAHEGNFAKLVRAIFNFFRKALGLDPVDAGDGEYERGVAILQRFLTDASDEAFAVHQDSHNGLLYDKVGEERGIYVDARRFAVGSLYTGSTADYDRPSLTKVGTGEGSQVYGWGLYASSKRGVAESYAKGGIGSGALTLDGKTYTDETPGPVGRIARRMGWLIDKGIEPTHENLTADVRDELSSREEQRKENEASGWSNENVDRWISDLKEDLAELDRNGSRMKWSQANYIYQQTFFSDREPGDESHLLKWYEPVSERQKAWILDQADKEGFANRKSNGFANQKAALEFDLDHFETGEEIYGGLSMNGRLGSPRAASEFLARAGIDGVKYPVDSYGKTVKDGNVVGWNYVSFRDDNIRVDHKWANGSPRYSVASRLDEERRAIEEAGGKLILAHHGTDSRGFTRFEKTDDIGYFFAKNRRTAASYIRNGGRGAEDTPGLPSYDEMLAYLKDEASGPYLEKKWWIVRENGQIPLFPVDGQDSFETEDDARRMFDAVASLIPGRSIKEGYAVGRRVYGEDEPLPYEELKNEYLDGTGEKSGIYNVALKMTDPYEIDCHGSNWDAIYDIPDTPDTVTYDRVILEYNMITEKFGLWTREYDPDRGYETPGKESGVESVDFDDFDSFKKAVAEKLGATFAESELEEIRSAADRGEDFRTSPVDGRPEKGSAGAMWAVNTAGLDGAEGWYVTPQNTRDIVQQAADMGCDGVIFKSVLDNGGGIREADVDDVYVVFNPEQVKSVDEMTYADDGTIIPAEARFDWGNKDIRYAAEPERFSDGEYKFWTLPERLPERGQTDMSSFVRDKARWLDEVYALERSQKGIAIGTRRTMKPGDAETVFTMTNPATRVEVGWPVYQMLRDLDLRSVNEPGDPISLSAFVSRNLKTAGNGRRYYEVAEWPEETVRKHLNTDGRDPYHQQALYFVAIGEIPGFTEKERDAAADRLIEEKGERMDALSALVKGSGAESVITPGGGRIDEAVAKRIAEKAGLKMGFSRRTAIVAFATNANALHIERMKDAVMENASVSGVYAACHRDGVLTFMPSDITPGKNGVTLTSAYGDAHKALARLAAFANPYWGANDLKTIPGYENLLNLVARFPRAALMRTSGAELLAHMWNYGGLEEIATRISGEAKRTAIARRGKIANRKYAIGDLHINDGLGGRVVSAAKRSDLMSGETRAVMDPESGDIVAATDWEIVTRYGDELYEANWELLSGAFRRVVVPHLDRFVSGIVDQLNPDSSSVHFIWLDDERVSAWFKRVLMSAIDYNLRKHGKKYVFFNKITDDIPVFAGEVAILSVDMFTGGRIVDAAETIREKFANDPNARKITAAAFSVDGDGQIVLTEAQLRSDPQFAKLSTSEINKRLGYEWGRLTSSDFESSIRGGKLARPLAAGRRSGEGSQRPVLGGQSQAGGEVSRGADVRGSAPSELEGADYGRRGPLSFLEEGAGSGRRNDGSVQEAQTSEDEVDRLGRYSVATRKIDWGKFPESLDHVVFNTSVQHLTGQDKLPGKYDTFKAYRDHRLHHAIKTEVVNWSRDVGPLKWLGKYLLAKYYGDKDAAAEVVRHRASFNRLGELRSIIGTDKDIRWIYVRNDDGRRTNRIPEAYANLLSERFGGKVDGNIAKVSDERNTSASMRTRALRDFQFSGEPESGKKYVIVDDVWTTGSTTASLLEYLDGKGAEVVGITTLAIASHGDEIRPTESRISAVLKKANLSSPEEGIEVAGVDIRKATGSELQAFVTGARPGKFGFVEWFDPSANSLPLDFTNKGSDQQSGMVLPPLFPDGPRKRLGLDAWRERNATQAMFRFASGREEDVSSLLVGEMGARSRRRPRHHAIDRRFAVSQTIDKAFPRLAQMSDEDLVVAAEAVRLALNTKGKGRFMNITRMQRDLKALAPGQSHEDLGVRAVSVTQAARNLAKKMRSDLDRGVSQSQILAHLPDAMKEIFGSEMTARLRTGAKVGVYAERARKEIERRQVKVITDAVANQTGVETKIMENAYGLDFSRTLMNLAENPYIRTDENGNRIPPERGDATGAGTDDDADGAAGGKTVEAKISEAVNEVAKRAHELSEAEKAKREELRRQAGRDAENQLAFNQEENAAEAESGEGSGAMFTGDEDLVDVATRKAGVNLEDPRELALFVSELSRKYWNDTHGLGERSDTWSDPVALQFLRKTAQNIYTKLVNDLVYSQARDTATRTINRFENAPTARGLVSDMTYVGQLIHAKRMADTQKAMCEKLSQFLEDNFGTSGRFKPDKEELRRKVSAEMELRARYTRHVIWLTPDALDAEVDAMLRNLHGVEAEFDDAGRDVDQSKVMVETLRKIQLLREFGGLVYKPLGQIQAAIEYWEDALRGDGERIVRENYERDVLTEKAAAKLAAAFNNPKLKTAIEEGLKSDLGHYIQSHMGFFVLLRDMMRHAPDDVRSDAERILQYFELEIQKSGTRAMTSIRRHSDAFAQAVQAIYHRDFQKVVADLNTRDDRFLEFMGESSPGKKEIPTKGKAMQLFVSLQQVGHAVEVMDDDGGSHVEWVGGYHDNIVKHHREGQAEKIRRLLTVEDLNLINWLGRWYEENRKNVSAVAEALFGIGVYSETANYMPVKMLLDPQGLEKGNAIGWSVFIRSLTPRVRNERDFDTSADILSMFMSRMEEAEQWSAHAKLGLEMRGVFGRSALRKSIRANHGKSTDQLVQGFITDILSGRGAGDLTTNRFLLYADKLRGMAALGALGGNLGVTLKQTTSIPAFGFEIGLANTTKNILTAWSPDGFSAMSEIFNSEERRNRWDVGNSEAVRNALAMRSKNVLMKLLKASMITNKIGDVVPALVIGQGIYRDALAQGLSREDAMARTWIVIERTQQSSRLENQPEFVRRNRAARMLFQFLTTQVQYLGYEAKAIREVMARPGDVRRWGSLGGVLLLNHFLLTSLYYGMGQLWKRLLGQEPPKDEEMSDWIVTCLLGPFGALYTAGFTATDAIRNWVKGKQIGVRGAIGTLPALSWAGNILVLDPASLVSAIFSHDKGTLDDVLSAAGKWLSDFNATFRDARRVYRYRIKGERQRK